MCVIQGYFSSEKLKLETEFGLYYNEANPTTAAANTSATSGIGSISAVAQENIDKFKAKLNSALNLFESHPFTTSELAQGLAAHKRARDESIARQIKAQSCDYDDSSSASSSHHTDMMETVAELLEYNGCKYLTSSQLFELELHDPQVRLQVLAQVVTFCHSFRIKLLSIIANMQSNATAVMKTAAAAAATVVTTKRGGRQTAATAAPPAPVQIPAAVATMNAIIVASDALYNDLGVIKTRAYNLLANTPPNGAEMVQTLQKILRRETKWIQWKNDACKEFERPPADGKIFVSALEKAKEIEKTNMYAFKGFKPSVEAGKPGPGKRIGFKQASAVSVYGSVGPIDTASYQIDLSTTKVTETAHNLVIDVPNFEDHFAFYIQAEDPDEGIDAEYHPKHDGVYCWRARRLLAAVRLKDFEKMQDGNLSKIVPKPASTAAASSEDSQVGEVGVESDGASEAVENKEGGSVAESEPTGESTVGPTGESALSDLLDGSVSEQMNIIEDKEDEEQGSVSASEQEPREVEVEEGEEIEEEGEVKVKRARIEQ
jgi:hypothetical protein